MPRATKFEVRFVKQAYELALLGLIDDEMAAVFGVSRSNFAVWKIKHPDFADALAQGKTLADAKVSAALFQRACGYSHPETLLHVVKGEIVKTRVTKRYPPDGTAAARWLYNRQRTKWQYQPDPAATDDDVAPVKVVLEVRDARRRPADAKPEPAPG